MFIRNTWYIAAHASAVSAQPLARTLLDETVVLFRTGDRIVALDDCCPHRLLPLSKGKVVGDTIVCGYHGSAYDGGGNCVSVPGQEAIPRLACVRSYPAVDRYGFVWIWMGDAELCNEALLPSMFHVISDPNYQATDGEFLSLGANYHLLTDNLMDASHAEFVHPSTLGTGGLQVTRGEHDNQDSFDVDIGEAEISYKIRLAHTAAGQCFHKGLAIKLGVDNYDQPVDWHMDVLWKPPAYFMFQPITMPAGGTPDDGVTYMSLTGLTPETATSMHYFWKVVQHRRYGDVLSKYWHETMYAAHSEDVEILEMQQQKIGDRDLHECQIASFQGDQLSLQLRKIVQQIAAKEARDSSSD